MVISIPPPFRPPRPPGTNPAPQPQTLPPTIIVPTNHTILGVPVSDTEGMLAPASEFSAFFGF